MAEQREVTVFATPRLRLVNVSRSTSGMIRQPGFCQEMKVFRVTRNDLV